MRKKEILIILSLSLFTISKATPIDSISTSYKNGVYTTYYQLWVNASDSTCNDVIRDFNYQMQYNLDALFFWALKDMNLRKEKDELMIFYFKSTSFNRATSVLRGTGDVIVPGIITIPNVYVDSKLSVNNTHKGSYTLCLNMLNSTGFIKSMNNSFSIIPSKIKGNWFVLKSSVRFDGLLNIFITQYRFKTIMEWRLKQFIHNLSNEAERREKASNHNNAK
jgi:hypothetical protein